VFANQATKRRIGEVQEVSVVRVRVRVRWCLNMLLLLYIDYYSNSSNARAFYVYILLAILHYKNIFAISYTMTVTSRAY